MVHCVYAVLLSLNNISKQQHKHNFFWLSSLHTIVNKKTRTTH